MDRRYVRLLRLPTPIRCVEPWKFNISANKEWHKPTQFGIMELTRNHCTKEIYAMSSITQNHFDENNLIDCVRRFFSRHHVGRLIARCNGMKEKGVSPVSLLRYKLSNIFVGRSMYMQQRTGSFKEDFSKNTFYRFLNSVKTNWLRFIIC